MPTEGALTPQAARRVAREATTQSFDKAAEALSEDWNIGLDGKQIERWAVRMGGRLKAERDAEVAASESGARPAAPANPPPLLVLGPDGGKVQMVAPNPETGSRWRDDKVFTVTSYLLGNGADVEPQKLITTHVATFEKTAEFGRLARVEAERRGLHHATQTIMISDCGNWIEPLREREFPTVPRIADWCHAEEHLHESSRAAFGAGTPAGAAFSAKLVDLLWDGKVGAVVHELKLESQKLGAPESGDGADHPRRVLAREVGYFDKNRAHMNYPEYRAKGWPIGSGNTEAGVKQFNKRVKGTDQFWQPEGLEAILCLRALWLSQDARWRRYWSAKPAYAKSPA